jgi:hypothetical protein
MAGSCWIRIKPMPRDGATFFQNSSCSGKYWNEMDVLGNFIKECYVMYGPEPKQSLRSEKAIIAEPILSA